MYRGSVNEVGSDELLNISSRPLGQRILRDKEDIFCNYPGKRTSPSNTPSNPPNTHQQQLTHPPQTSSPTHNTDQSIGRQTASNTKKKKTMESTQKCSDDENIGCRRWNSPIWAAKDGCFLRLSAAGKWDGDGGRPWFEGAGRRRLLLKIPRAGIGFTKIVPNKYESLEVTNFFHVWIF